jgi:hypothetical protein
MQKQGQGQEEERGQGRRQEHVHGELYQTMAEGHSPPVYYPPVARFLTVYIEEAHASDEWYLPHAHNAQPGWWGNYE